MRSASIFHRFSSASYAPYGSIQSSYTLSNGHPVYFYTHGPEKADTTFFLLHGAPGSHKDFKYLAPLLVRENVNVVAFDLPGNGATGPYPAGGIENLNADNINRVATEVIDNLESKRTFILGHSCGGHTAIEVASKIKKRVDGLALLNTMGLRPHQAIRPFPMMNFSARQLQKPGPIRELVAKANHYYFVSLGQFPRRTPVDVLAFGLQRFGSANFVNTKSFVQDLNERKVPTFIALAHDDVIVEKEVILELGQVLPPGIRKEYEIGGHNLQKTQAEDIAENLIKWSSV
ncbi:serine protease family S33 [Thraustotheca clavata]|uniref:Serine protease family S33 n=1 Tax=Thraustotheca clavata TaxID=74557 RepID=A0A1V9ZXH8_9STRA|nr:serine protease family S33 [Thraustotheca clavata]